MAPSSSAVAISILMLVLFDIVPETGSFMLQLANKNQCQLPLIIGCTGGYISHFHNRRDSLTFLRLADEDEIYDYDDDNDDEYDDDDEFRRSSSLFNDDWLEAEFTLVDRDIPTSPSPELDAPTVANLVCRSLQWVDYPTSLAGLKRCYEFFTPSFREFATARQGGKTVERFVQFGVLAPALQPFMGASRVNVKFDEATMIDAKPPLRGALCTIPIDICGAPVLTLQHPSGIHRAGIATSPPITKMVLRLEQQRRPPHQGCWMVREILDVRHAFAGDMGNAHVGA